MSGFSSCLSVAFSSPHHTLISSAWWRLVDIPPFLPAHVSLRAGLSFLHPLELLSALPEDIFQPLHVSQICLSVTDTRRSQVVTKQAVRWSGSQHDPSVRMKIPTLTSILFRSLHHTKTSLLPEHRRARLILMLLLLLDPSLDLLAHLTEHQHLLLELISSSRSAHGFILAHIPRVSLYAFILVFPAKVLSTSARILSLPAGISADST